jgi:flagellar basal-body rod modification protein FlgD
MSTTAPATSSGWPASALNTVDTTAANALQAANRANQSLGKDAFLKLLVAQLKNQDPQNPADSSQMAAQLAQFSSVEQLTNINEQLTTQATSQSSLISQIQASGATSNIGRVITANSDLLQLDGSGNETLMVTGNGGPATLNIFDASTGKSVGTRNMGSLASGTNEIVVGQALKDLPPGVYRVTVTPSDSGSKATFTTAVKGIVTGVENTSTGLQYLVGQLLVPVTSVTAVTTR